MKYFKYAILSIFFLGFITMGLVLVLVTCYKQEIKDVLIHTLKAKYGLDLKVEKIHVSVFSDWPNASVKLKGVSLSNDSSYNTCKRKPLLKAETIFLSLDIKRLLKKEFIVNLSSINKLSRSRC